MTAAAALRWGFGIAGCIQFTTVRAVTNFPCGMKSGAAFLERNLHIKSREKVSNSSLGVILSLIQNAHFQGGSTDIIKRLQAGAVLQIGVDRDPWRPPRNLVIPDLDVFFIEKGIE